MKNLNTKKKDFKQRENSIQWPTTKKLPLLVDRESLAYNDNYQQRIQ